MPEIRKAPFDFTIIEKATGTEISVQQYGTSRLNAFTILTKKKGNTHEIRWV